VPHLTRRAWLVVGVAIAGLAALSVTIAGAQTDDTPRGTDPLSADELTAASDLAQGSNPGEAAGLGDDDVVLLVERHEEAKADEDNGLRRADVYVYSYDDNVLTWTVVDTATGEVDQSQVVPDTQLPLIQDEENRALEIALADPEFAQLLATRYRQATGRDLVDPATDLDIQPIVFRSDANPRAAAAGAQACGEHRCAQLMIQSTDDFLVNLLPVIDLSSDRLLTETGFFS
jgi:Cu2+-containing amine oxidase